MSDKLTLLGCPFCGAPGEAVVVPPPYSSATIRCRDCRAETGMCDDEQRAAIAWNSRAALAAEEESGWRTMDSAPKEDPILTVELSGSLSHPTYRLAVWHIREWFDYWTGESILPDFWHSLPAPPSPKDKTP